MNAPLTDEERVARTELDACEKEYERLTRAAFHAAYISGLSAAMPELWRRFPPSRELFEAEAQRLFERWFLTVRVAYRREAKMYPFAKPEANQ